MNIDGNLDARNPSWIGGSSLVETPPTFPLQGGPHGTPSFSPTESIAVEALDLLAEQGYDPVFGARPFLRLIQDKVQNPLALMLLEGKISDGDLVLGTVSGKPRDELELWKKPAESAARGTIVTFSIGAQAPESEGHP